MDLNDLDAEAHFQLLSLRERPAAACLQIKSQNRLAALIDSETGQNGRFEMGIIYLGQDPGSVAVNRLDGNGPNYVRRTTAGGIPTIDIPVVVRDRDQENPISRVLVAWEEDARKFRLDSPVPSRYVAGSLNVVGITWTIVSVDATGNVVVAEPTPIPFLLRDDDTGTHPYDVHTALLEPETGVLGQAYIRVQVDRGGSQIAPFNRNVPCAIVQNPPPPRCVPQPPFPPDECAPPLDDRWELKCQLKAGREHPGEVSTTAFWTMYVQGAFQGDTQGDFDPGSELFSSAAGVTEPGFTFDDDDDHFGSLVFEEVIWDSIERAGHPPRDPAQFAECVPIVVAHEIGHQFGLDDRGDIPAGLMQRGGCFIQDPYFLADELANIRCKNRPGTCTGGLR